jgi:hypothetical protein
LKGKWGGVMASLRRLCGLLCNPRPYRKRITADIRLRFTPPKCSATPRTFRMSAERYAHKF